MRFSSIIDCLEDRTMLNAFELVETEDMISFSAGFPSPESYPLDAIKDSFDRVIEKEGREAMSYCSTSGFRRLREIIVERMERKFGVRYDVSECIITSGSQQGLDMSGRLFVNKGDVVLFESPSYLGAVNALRAYEAELVSVPTDENGIIISELEKAFNKYGDRIRMIYVIPDFQNPTGRSWSDERRQEFMEFMYRYDVPVVEDAAYSELAFDMNCRKPLSRFDKKGQVIYVGTFSKTFCPGLRIAWICARGEIMDKYLLLKNAADLSSSAISQRQMAYYLDHYNLDEHIKGICTLYRHRRDIMIGAIEKYFPENVSFTVPEGGLFVWMTLPEGKDSRELLRRAGETKVAFIPGISFYPAGEKCNELRLNFSNMSDDETEHGMKILGELTEKYLEE